MIKEYSETLCSKGMKDFAKKRMYKDIFIRLYDRAHEGNNRSRRILSKILSVHFYSIFKANAPVEVPEGVLLKEFEHYINRFISNGIKEKSRKKFEGNPMSFFYFRLSSFIKNAPLRFQNMKIQQINQEKIEEKVRFLEEKQKFLNDSIDRVPEGVLRNVLAARLQGMSFQDIGKTVLEGKTHARAHQLYKKAERIAYESQHGEAEAANGGRNA